MNYYDYPVAILFTLDHEELIVGTCEPPPAYYYLPTRVKPTVRVEEPAVRPFRQDREFRRTRFRSSSHQWLHVYNEGRSATPRDAYVYFERRP